MKFDLHTWYALLDGASLHELLDELVAAASSIQDDSDVREFKIASLRLKIREFLGEVL